MRIATQLERYLEVLQSQLMKETFQWTLHAEKSCSLLFIEKALSLPQGFIRGEYIGVVEEIKQFHEVGELAKPLEGFPVRDPNWVCETCGNDRFLPCPYCDGSRKVFDEEEDQLRRCPDCNENGLIR